MSRMLQWARRTDSMGCLGTNWQAGGSSAGSSHRTPRGSGGILGSAKFSHGSGERSCLCLLQSPNEKRGWLVLLQEACSYSSAYINTGSHQLCRDSQTCASPGDFNCVPEGQHSCRWWESRQTQSHPCCVCLRYRNLGRPFSTWQCCCLIEPLCILSIFLSRMGKLVTPSLLAMAKPL